MTPLSSTSTATPRSEAGRRRLVVVATRRLLRRRRNDVDADDGDGHRQHHHHRQGQQNFDGWTCSSSSSLVSANSTWDGGDDDDDGRVGTSLDLSAAGESNSNSSALVNVESGRGELQRIGYYCSEVCPYYTLRFFPRIGPAQKWHLLNFICFSLVTA